MEQVEDEESLAQIDEGRIMSTKLGIVYSTVSKILRRVIDPSNDSDLSAPGLIRPGETLLVVDKSTIQTASDINTAVFVATGVQPPNSRCALINGTVTGTVIGIIQADPLIDTVPGMTLVLSPTAVVGQSWSLVGGFV